MSARMQTHCRMLTSLHRWCTPIHSITVRNPNAGKAIVGAFASFTGGESSTYIEMAEKARERAFARMLEHAAAAGGNAVIGVQFTGQEIMERMTEVMCYGTAVTLAPQAPAYSQYSQPQQQQFQQQPLSPGAVKQ
ncbi:putative heavy-metal-binding-domain-containing protein [Mortierella sp. GBAus27b]|nr:putative heavy-metal-binding-domain-containing protein [Mortierella sp. GBAus27b]